MPILQDHDVAIWCCPNGDIYQIIEFKVGDPEPVRKFCSKCGARYVNRCPNKSCPHPTFHPSDAVANVHGPCGAKIPWAEARNSAVIVGPGFQSKLIGTGSYMGKSSLAPDSVTDIDHDNRDPPHRRIPTAEPVDVTRDLDVVVPRSRKPVITEIYRSKELRAAEPHNLNRYFLVAGRAIDKPPRKAVRAVLRFVRDRGEVVGRGADKGLEDVGTWAVKLVFGLLLALLFTYCGIRLSQ